MSAETTTPPALTKEFGSSASTTRPIKQVSRHSGQPPQAQPQPQTASPRKEALSGALTGTFLQQETVQLVQKAQHLETFFQKREQELEQAAEALRAKTAEEEQRIELMKRKAQLEIDSEKRDCKRTISQRIKWEKAELQREKRELVDMKSRVAAINPSSQGRITLDVGGDKFKTELRTLLRHPNSLFQELVRVYVAEEHRPPNRPRSEDIFIDRDSKHFRLILNFLRQGGEVLRGSALKGADRYMLYDILCEVKYYKLTELERLIQRRIIALDKPLGFDEIASKCRLVKKPSSTAKTTPQATGAADPYVFTTNQSILLKEKNLTGVVFNRVHFQHPASFECSILQKAEFRGCFFEAAINFTNCDLYSATFDHCEGVLLEDRLLITGACMEKVTFNPPLHVDGSDEDEM